MRIRDAIILVIAMTSVGTTIGALPVAAQETPGEQRRPMERVQDLARQEAEIRRTRTVVRRVVRDRRASDEIKQQANELETLLDKRQEIIARLQARQKEFATQHKGELDELEELRRRARELDDRLGTARRDVIETSKDDVAALKDASARAADLADGIRARYLEERRGGRGRARREAQQP